MNHRERVVVPLPSLMLDDASNVGCHIAPVGLHESKDKVQRGSDLFLRRGQYELILTWIFLSVLLAPISPVTTSGFIGGERSNLHPRTTMCRRQ